MGQAELKLNALRSCFVHDAIYGLDIDVTARALVACLLDECAKFVQPPFDECEEAAALVKAVLDPVISMAEEHPGSANMLTAVRALLRELAPFRGTAAAAAATHTLGFLLRACSAGERPQPSPNSTLIVAGLRCSLPCRGRTRQGRGLCCAPGEHRHFRNGLEAR